MVLCEPGFTYNLLFTRRFYWLASFGKNRPAPLVDPAFRFVLPFLHCAPPQVHFHRNALAAPGQPRPPGNACLCSLFVLPRRLGDCKQKNARMCPVTKSSSKTKAWTTPRLESASRGLKPLDRLA